MATLITFSSWEKKLIINLGEKTAINKNNIPKTKDDITLSAVFFLY